MKSILVLTDFSDRAQAASEYAMHLAISLKADLLLCHALEITEQYHVENHIALKNQTIKRLQEVGRHLHEVRPQDGEDDFSPAITYATGLETLTDLAGNVVEKKDVALAVIGLSQSTSWTRFLFGSHTNDILDNINCPVLLVPESAVFKSIRNIAYATDLTFNNSSVISYLLKLAKPFGAKIRVNHISLLDLPPTSKEQEAQSSIIKMGAELVFRKINGDDIAKGLLEITDSEPVDILTLVHKRYDFFEGLFHSSVSKQLAHSSKVPLLVMPYSFSLIDDVQTNLFI